MQASQTCAMMMQEYLSTQRRLEPATRALSRRAFSYLAEAVGAVRVGDFGLAQAQRFQTWLIDRGLSPASANVYCKTVRPVFRWAMRLGVLESDPFAALPPFRIPKGKIRIYEADEVQALLHGCPDRLWRLRIMLAVTAGLRRGEVLNLTAADCDFAAGLLWVQPKKDSAHTWAWSVKDKDRRIVPMTDETAGLLQRQLLDLPTGQPYLCLTPRRYRRLIGLKRAGILADRLRACPDENFTKPFERIGRRAGVQVGTFHDLRRTCLTVWLENGLQPHEVMQLAGHAEIDTTMRYYVATRRTLMDKARRASQGQTCPAKDPTIGSPGHEGIGATGLEPATS